MRGACCEMVACPWIVATYKMVKAGIAAPCAQQIAIAFYLANRHKTTQSRLC